MKEAISSLCFSRAASWETARSCQGLGCPDSPIVSSHLVSQAISHPAASPLTYFHSISTLTISALIFQKICFYHKNITACIDRKDSDTIQLSLLNGSLTLVRDALVFQDYFLYSSSELYSQHLSCLHSLIAEWPHITDISRNTIQLITEYAPLLSSCDDDLWIPH